MKKVKTKGESNQITLAVFKQLNKEQRENLLNGLTVEIKLSGKSTKIKWVRETGCYYKITPADVSMVEMITPQKRLQLKSQLAERTKIRRRKEDERRQHIYK